MVATTFKMPLEEFHTSNSIPSPPPVQSDLHPHRRLRSMPQPTSVSARKNRGVRFDQEQHQTRNDSEKITNIPEVKVLLLGQSGSGKSTLQRNLQIHLSQTHFKASRSAYKPVIYLNIITALRALLIELDYQLSFPELPSPLSIADDNPKFFALVKGLRDEAKLDETRARLLPLMALENLLVAELTEGVTFATSNAQTKAFVRPGWQFRIARFWNLTARSSSDLALLCSKTLAFSVPDIHALWNHWITKFYISKRVVPLDDTAPYFLDHIERIGGVGYCPTDEDILRARIQTVGVTEAECAMPLSVAQNPAWKWKVYDVSGVRGQRGVWIPFFDDASVVIFLAPISAFDQYLPENPTVNRLVDSLQLWASICSNKLLQHARLVLFLNKIDLLKKKLNEGVSIRKYITSFSNRPNDFITAASYFRAHFEQIQRRRDVVRPKRRLFVHFTSMLDTKAVITQCVVSQVKEVILKRHAEEQTVI